MPGLTSEFASTLDARSLLDALGYPEDAYDMAMGWTERAASGQLVQGFRLISRRDASGFDVYCSMEGQLLDAAQQMAWGIRPKDWTPRTMTRPPEIDLGFPKNTPTQPPEPLCIAFRLSIPQLLLSTPNIAQALHEDETGTSTPAKGVARVGLLQPLARPIEITGMQCSDGAWQTLPNGVRVWRLELRSLGALGQRFHLSKLRTPTGAGLYVYDADEPTEIYGPFFAAEDFWTPTCFGEGVVLECQVPASCDINAISFTLDQASYNYQDIGRLAKTGACNLDVSCYDAWHTTSMGVGGIGSMGAGGVLWCTGALIADADTSSVIPYFLTANHCISGQSAAATIEVYWLYQTNACNATPPDPAFVPRTSGGADYLAGTAIRQGGTDFTLLRLRNAPPAGLVYLGFHTGPLTLGSGVVGIHHPQGDFKRISFGHSINTGSPYYGGEHLQLLSRFHEIDWDFGTTEAGSSGSPLFLNGLQMIIGQLWGGQASCSYPDEPDYFGRLDVTYPLIDTWLGNPPSPYDVDQSGAIDNADVQHVVDAALAIITPERTDVDNSGEISARDILLVAIAALNSR